MKKLIALGITVFFVSVSGGYAASSSSQGGAGDTQSYTAIVPGMAAIAEWVAEFADTYRKHGIYQAVAEVFEEGLTPEEIAENALSVEGVNPQNLVAALYCAGANPEDVRAASEEVGISEMILVAGFETAKTVCGDEITDTQAYTPAGPSFAGVPGGGGGGGRVYASPSVPGVF